MQDNQDCFYKFLGMRLQELRLFRGLHLKEVSSHLEITPQQLSKYERGINRIPAYQLVKVSNLLKVPVTMFFPVYESEFEQVFFFEDIRLPLFDVQPKVA